MKRIVLLLFAIVFGVSILLSQDVSIPNANFLDALIEGGVDTDEDGQISIEEAEAVTNLNVSGNIISDITGIEAFVNIEYLDCSCNQLDSLDVSSNTSLIEFNCNDNRLENLDISNNTELRILNCSVNTLISLDVSNNIVLNQLHCEVNFIKSIDFSNNLALSELYCGNIGLNSLDVSNNLALRRLDCREGNLVSLDVSNNSSLEYLNCSNNQLTSLDLSNNTSLSRLECIKNQLTILDLSNTTALTHVICHDNQLVSIDIFNITTLVYLDCRSNQLSSLDISTNTALEGINCSENYLISLDLSKNTRLGSGDEEWQLINICMNPTLYKVCVWTLPFPPTNVKISYQGSPNVDFTTECSTGIEESSASVLSVYPNPANSLITIELDKTDQYSIEIVSLSGQLIFRSKMEGGLKQIDLSPFSNGIYFVTAISKEFLRTAKFVKCPDN